MRVLVTGAAGFIGSNLCNTLHREGHNVYAIDNLRLGKQANLNPEIPFLTVSVLDRPRLKDWFSNCDPEYVVHLAAASSSPMFNNDEWMGLDTNIMGFAHVMYRARKTGVKKVIYASSSSIYSGNYLPWSEGLIIQPKTFYEVSFKAREDIANAYREQHGFPSVGLRFFSVYGPNETHKGRYANTITQFLWDIKAGRSPIIYGDGSQARDFIHVDDVVRCIKAAIQNPVEHTIYNVGTGKSYSFNEVVDKLRRRLNMAGRTLATYVDNPVTNYIRETRAEKNLAIMGLGFRAKIDLDEGIDKLIEAYK
jgi:UDP-glucose 4-epimerase